MRELTKIKLERLEQSLHSPLFADRKTLGEAAAYVTNLAAAAGHDGITIWTAVGVMLNTISKEIKKIIAEDNARLKIGDTVYGRIVYGKGNDLIGNVTGIEDNDLSKGNPCFSKTAIVKWDNGQVARFFEKDLTK